MPPVRVAFDDFLGPDSSNLDVHVPDLQIAGWEYGGGSTGWFIKNPGRTQRQPAGGRYVRTTADISIMDLTSQPFTVEADLVKAAVDSTVSDALIGFFQRGSGVATPYDGEGIWVGWERTSASTANVVARRVNPGGGIAETLIFANISVPPNRRYTFDVAADGVTITATVSDLFTGLSPIALGTVVLTADIRNADHQRLGVSGRDVGSSASDTYSYDLLQDAALLNPWDPCDPCVGPTVWVDSACPAIPAVAFSAGFSGGFE